MFRTSEVKKTYWAVVKNAPQEPEGELVVSYTHLDVYKRQMPICSVLPYWCVRYFIRNRKKRTSVFICRNTAVNIGMTSGPEKLLKERCV